MARAPYPHLYGTSLALLTDLYELTMAYGYWASGMIEREATFHLSFRTLPFQGGFAVAAGLEDAIRWLKSLKFEESDINYLKTLRGSDEEPLFSGEFLDYLAAMEFTCNIDAIPEGTVVFPHQPLVRVQGPLLQAQIIESALLCIINFQTLIATKAARIVQAARGDQVLEFGMRRAHGIDGALSASRAAFIGGCNATSSTLAGKLFGIPVAGTQAHSWIMSFDDELEAFETYSRALPNNCVFLVDTYNTLKGVTQAIEVGKELRERGYEMIGIRLDSGDLAYLSIEARRMLDAAGFPNSVITASNELDETIIADLKRQGAPIVVWGVGTRLVTGHSQTALDGVYKISALRDPGGEWQPTLKLSEQLIKVSNPGVLQARRYKVNGINLADLLYEEGTDLSSGCVVVDPLDETRQKVIEAEIEGEDLLVPIFRTGRLVYALPSLVDIRARTFEEIESLHPGITRFVHPHQYVAGMEEGYYKRKMELTKKTRRKRGNNDRTASY